MKLTYIVWHRRFPNRPHFHRVQAEVFLCGQLGAAVGGALGSGAAVTSAEVAVEPQAEVAVLTAHTLVTADGGIQDQQSELGRCYDNSLRFQCHLYNPDPDTWLQQSFGIILL